MNNEQVNYSNKIKCSYVHREIIMKMNNEHYTQSSIMTVALALSAGFILSVGQDVERTLDGCSRDGLCGGWDGPHRSSSRDAGEAEEAGGAGVGWRGGGGRNHFFFRSNNFCNCNFHLFPPQSGLNSLSA